MGAFQSPVIYGLALGNNLSDLPDKDNALRSLGLEPTDLASIGNINEYMGRDGFQAISNLDEPIQRKLSRYNTDIIRHPEILNSGVDLQNINSKFVKDYDPTVISYYELGGGVLFFSIFLLFTNSFNSEFFQLTTSDFVYLLILSSVCTAYAFIASTAVMKFLSPYTVMLTINLEPIYGIILAVIIFEDKEQMSPQFYVGAVIILLTVILNGILKSRLKTT
jgi:hypothetical protein